MKAAGAMMVLTAALATPSTDVRIPLIIGHRGFAGHRPEHTLEGYRLAAEAGADYIEPDLVSTKDGVLIARHENEIGSTTDAEQRFPDRKRSKIVDGVSVTGYFSEDFTLEEIRTLKARERLPSRSHAYDGQYAVPTFAEVIDLAQRLGEELARPVGIYPETKHPSYFRDLGLPLEPRVVAALAARGWNGRAAPIFIQSFEESSLKALRQLTQARLILLLEADRHLSDDRLREIATFADGIGPDRRLVIPARPDGWLMAPTDLVVRAHAAGLLVHVWTLRDEEEFLSPSYHSDPLAEYRQFRELGVDGLFTDFADTAVKALRR